MRCGVRFPSYRLGCPPTRLLGRAAGAKRHGNGGYLPAGVIPARLRRLGGVRDHLPPGLPPDPFADDPCDPSAALEAVEPGQPLDQQERMAVEADLADLAVYEALLAHKGIRGLVVCCDECQQDHYHDWDMLRANLLQLLIDGTVRPHEPAYDPEPDAYVTWDYCRGYADASLNEATSDADGFGRRI